MPTLDLKSPASTLMYREAAETGAAVSRFLSRNGEALAALGARLRENPPSLLMTCARGSSDHAATYGKYVLETLCHVPVASAAPSIASVFGGGYADLRGVLLIAVSQSGRSPDLLKSVQAHREAGATIVALVNDITSPLAEMADIPLPLHAGPEFSVAATKSCIVSMVGFAAIAAAGAQDTALSEGLAQLPSLLDEAFTLDWTPALPALAEAASLYVIGRGYGLGIAQEMALKLKETCGLHAEGFSAAEVRHGPMAIARDGFPVLALATSDRSGASVREVASELTARDANLLLADAACDAALPALSGHPAIEPLLMLASFYHMANSLSLRRGLDPDQPPFLAKVTRTL